MFSIEIVLLGLALAMDAAVVGFAIGLLNTDLANSKKWERGVYLSLVFGFAQFLMLWMGSYGGYLFSFSQYGHLFHLVVACIFFVIGSKLLQESFTKEKRVFHWGILSILMLAIATSIDALAAGMSLGTLPNAHLAAIAVGIITFLVCLTFYIMSQFLKQIPEKWLLRFASVIFFLLGFDIVMDFTSKGIL